MSKYRKKPVVIDAAQYYRASPPHLSLFMDGLGEEPVWIEEALEKGVLFFDNYGELYVKTLEGNHYASSGDQIIRGVKGELYPCKPDIFTATYEPVEEE